MLRMTWKIVCSLCALALIGCIAGGCSSVQSNDETVCYGPNGRDLAAGETFSNGCNSCICEAAGSIACTDEACVEACEYEGNAYDLGESFPAGDGCNLCQCVAPNDVSCTTIACGATCMYNGQGYAVGQRFPADDACNTCTCEASGDVSCTQIACNCDPATEWQRQYVTTDAAQCALIDYTCQQNTTPFENPCGCGCEMDPSCLETYDCTNNQCDPVQTLIDCPFSTVLE